MKVIFAVFTVFIASVAEARLKVAATTPDLEALARAVGGDRVEAFAIAKGHQDPHQIEAKPSFMVKLRDADLLLSHGLDLESAWIEPLVVGSRNQKIRSGSRGQLELGPALEPIEVATGPVSRAEGDVHPQGNPHFHLDPERMGRAAVLLAARLKELDPEGASSFETNAKAFKDRLAEREKSWRKRISHSGVKEFASYHKTFAYFASRFGLRNSIHLEPKPGIPPTAAHLLGVIREMKSRSVKLVLIENFFEDNVRRKIEDGVPGARIVKVPVYVGGTDAMTSTEVLIENLVRILEQQ